MSAEENIPHLGKGGEVKSARREAAWEATDII